MLEPIERRLALGGEHDERVEGVGFDALLVLEVAVGGIDDRGVGLLDPIDQMARRRGEQRALHEGPAGREQAERDAGDGGVHT